MYEVINDPAQASKIGRPEGQNDGRTERGNNRKTERKKAGRTANGKNKKYLEFKY